MIHRYSIGPNYNVTTICPSKPFHGRYTTRVRSICRPPRPLKSQPEVRVQLREELIYRNSAAAMTSRSPCLYYAALECMVRDGRTMDAGGLSRDSVGVQLDTSASDSRILAQTLFTCEDWLVALACFFKKWGPHCGEAFYY